MDSLNTIKYLIPLLFEGFIVTLYISLVGLALSLLLGLIIGIIRYLRIPILNSLSIAYIDVMRGLPFLMVLYIVYYLLPILFGIILPKLTTGILCLTLHCGAYFSDIFRSSLESVPKGQSEASESLGLSTYQKIRYIIFPQAYRISLPPLAGHTVLLVKFTSQVSLIGIMEITRIAKIHMQVNQQPFLTFSLVAAFYFIICYPMVWFTDRLEKITAFESEG
jgi:polar amino acid transport system permease protein